jgi:NO-binding membrane sensor protein with MHYT domain
MTTLSLLLVGGVHEGTVNQLYLGLWIPLLAYAVAVVGSVVGLACTRQAAKEAGEADRRRWLILAAVSIGGVAVWLMHFVAMLGMEVPGTVMRYNLLLALVSAPLAISATYFALLIVGREIGTFTQFLRLLAGGVTMGLAANLMHYVGMSAMTIQGTISYDRTLVIASLAIAVVAGTVALWFAMVLRSGILRVLAGFVMGVAVVGMHYTGMAAMSVKLDPAMGQPNGLTVFSFLFPMFVVAGLALGVPVGAVMMAGNGDDDHAVAPDIEPADAVHA